MNSEHPSAFALDLIALGQSNSTVETHLATCAQCQAHVRHSSPSEAPLPAWVPQRPTRTRSWWWPAVATAPALVALAVIVTGALRSDTPQTRSKGLPSVALYVEHRGDVRVWNGHSPIAAGDRLQLKIRSSGYKHALVGSEEDAGLKVIHSEVLSPSGETTLSRSFLVDAASDRVVIHLLLCDTTCSEGALKSAAKQSLRDEHQWWTRLVLVRKDAP